MASPTDRLVINGMGADGNWCTVTVTQEPDGSWLVHVTRSPVRLTGADMLAVARAIVARAEQGLG